MGFLSKCPLNPGKRAWKHRCRTDEGRFPVETDIQQLRNAQLCSALQVEEKQPQKVYHTPLMCLFGFVLSRPSLGPWTTSSSPSWPALHGLRLASRAQLHNASSSRSHPTSLVTCPGASQWLPRCETPRDTLCPPQGNPGVLRVKTPQRELVHSELEA